jgi:sRNA-binding protein
MSVKNIMFEIEGLIKNTVVSCASLYGFSVEEALAKIDSNGNLIRAVKATVDKEALVEQKKILAEEKKRAIEAKKAEKLRIKAEKDSEKETLAKQKEAEKEQKKAEKAEKAEKLRLKEAENIVSKEALKV